MRDHAKYCSWINTAGTVVFILFSYWMTAIVRADMLFRGQELSLFQFSSSFFADKMTQPAGFLEYAGRFLTQFFYYPWLGGLIFTGMLCLLAWMVYKAFGIDKNNALVSFLPSAALLLFVTQFDYTIYIVKYSDIFYMNLLGTMAALIPVMLCRTMHNRNCVVAVLLFMVAGYPLFGFYALLGVITAAVCKRNKAVTATSIIAAATVPLAYHCIYHDCALKFMYIYGFPFRALGTSVYLWIPLFADYLFIILLPALRGRLGVNVLRISQKAAIPLCIALVLTFSYRDSSFRKQLAIERAIHNGNWNKVLEISSVPCKEQSRLICLYRNIALSQKGVMLDEMFKYPYETSSTLNTKNKRATYTEIGSTIIPFYYGLANNCYRWNMESLVNNGACVSYYKNMLLCSVLSGERQLSQRYARQLSSTLFYKKWADRYIAYAFDGKLFAKDKTLNKVKALNTFDNVLGEDDVTMESTILFHYLETEPESLAQIEMSMGIALITKSNSDFWYCFEKYANNAAVLPRHVQEAALMFGMFQDFDMEQIERMCNRDVIKRFEQFTDLVREYGNTGMSQEKVGRIAEKNFGDTYWYYYQFVNGEITN